MKYASYVAGRKNAPGGGFIVTANHPKGILINLIHEQQTAEATSEYKVALARDKYDWRLSIPGIQRCSG